MTSLDPIVHPLPRLAICATLYGASAFEGRNEMRFSRLSKATELSASALSKHLRHLEQAGYVTKFREIGSTRAKDVLWLQLTEAGLQAYLRHMDALQRLVEKENPQPNAVRAVSEER
ncbi:transcriptional regulator [Corynebacterium gerontici]|uniref:Bacterial regulatory protein, arsR family n=1 Tax=Corynebacterium gerontici TaxID=2079234 RepID=A0A3G6IZI2_9CORY|nr:transcriptional regulator [Corynebacterium gerontici]AZA11112.1 Bacterial regulatory protein, arsR family [Corynebacterium gerontici]